jgi:CBS domain containing-hemolysin-like protein
VCYPIAFPISLLLDRLLGREISGVFSRQGLLALVRLNVESEEHQQESGLSASDARILGGALTFADRCVADVMTPMEQCFCLPLSTSLDRQTILQILQRGHTRIPVYDGRPDRIIGLLFCKDLLGVGFERAMPLETVLESFGARERVRFVGRSTKLDDALATCQRERVHMLIVAGEGEGEADVIDMESAHGIATMEDFLEEIIGEEIVDETDVWLSNAVGSPSDKPKSSPSRRSPLKRLRTRVGDGMHSRRQDDRNPPALRKMNSRKYDTTALLGSLGDSPSAVQEARDSAVPATSSSSTPASSKGKKWWTPRSLV